jgi:hypothetical protein
MQPGSLHFRIHLPVLTLGIPATSLAAFHGLGQANGFEANVSL